MFNNNIFINLYEKMKPLPSALPLTVAAGGTCMRGMVYLISCSLEIPDQIQVVVQGISRRTYTT